MTPVKMNEYCFLLVMFCFNIPQTQEREAKAEMRRKAKELQQARRDAERSGKKVPPFGGFGNTGMTSVSSGSIITDTIVEPEKPKITPAPARYTHPLLFHVFLYSTQGAGPL